MQEQAGFVFGPFRLDVRDERLWRGQDVLPMRHKTLGVLHALVAQAGQLLTKDALLAAVWPETMVSESVLTVAIRELRRVLGDQARRPQFIETVHGRGYRFIAPVTVAAPSSERPQTTGTLRLPPPVVRGRAVDMASTTPALPPEPTPLPAASIPPSDPQPDAAASGASSPVTPRSEAAERRQLTILCCDLVDSALLAEQLDPEEYRDVVHAYYGTCAAVIQRFDGYIVQYLGAGLLVYFGYPQAHDDDAYRAVRAGLDMVQALQRLNTQSGAGARASTGHASWDPHRPCRCERHGRRRETGAISVGGNTPYCRRAAGDGRSGYRGDQPDNLSVDPGLGHMRGVGGAGGTWCASVHGRLSRPGSQ